MTSINQDSKLEQQVTQLQSELSQLNKLFEFTSITNAVSDIDSLAIHLNSFLVETFKLKNIAFFSEQEGFYRIISHENIDSPFSFEFKDDGEGIVVLVILGISVFLLAARGYRFKH